MFCCNSTDGNTERKQLLKENSGFYVQLKVHCWGFVFNPAGFSVFMSGSQQEEEASYCLASPASKPKEKSRAIEHNLLLRVVGRFLESVCVLQEEAARSQACGLCLCRALARAGDWGRFRAGQPCPRAVGSCCQMVPHCYMSSRNSSQGRADTVTVVFRSDSRQIVAASVFYPLNRVKMIHLVLDSTRLEKVGLSCVPLHSVALSVSKLSALV